jgi:hypothetical protein
MLVYQKELVLELLSFKILAARAMRRRLHSSKEMVSCGAAATEEFLLLVLDCLLFLLILQVIFEFI